MELQIQQIFHINNKELYRRVEHKAIMEGLDLAPIQPLLRMASTKWGKTESKRLDLWLEDNNKSQLNKTLVSIAGMTHSRSQELKQVAFNTESKSKNQPKKIIFQTGWEPEQVV